MQTPTVVVSKGKLRNTTTARMTAHGQRFDRGREYPEWLTVSPAMT
ncbi:hypothetical protein [Arthrobacter sp. UNC362MFTsu5.1]|jgi:hypothetical protein|nr:hypothetical protein [Arthrobacter sp. UNC362MFTsu5.1]